MKDRVDAFGVSEFLPIRRREQRQIKFTPEEEWPIPESGEDAEQALIELGIIEPED